MKVLRKKEMIIEKIRNGRVDMGKHILVVSQHFYPEEFRINDITKEWIQRGYKVTVITGLPNYPQGKIYEDYGYFKKRKENYKGIEIIRLPVIPRGKNSIMLVLNYLSFVISGFFWQLFSKVDPDLIFNFETSPVTQALPAIWISKRKKKPFIMYVQDLWPDNVQVVAGVNNRLIIELLNKMVDYIYENTDLILTTSNSFKKTIMNRGINKNKVSYWPQYAEKFYVPLNKEYKNEIIQDNKFNITFTGNIGEAQGLELLPKVANKLIKKGERNFRFNIIGEGRFKKEFMHLVQEKKLDDYFVFIDRKPAKEIPKYLAMSDAGYLSFKNHELFNQTIPAKLQSYLSSGIPIIASASGETKRILEESEAGVCSPTGDVEALTNNIVKMIHIDKRVLYQMSKRARDYYEEKFCKEDLLDQFDTYYERVVKGN